jgi:hypothetical protein
MAPAVTAGRDGTAHALAAGQTFTDPAGGVSITTQSVGPDGAVIKVDITGTLPADAGSETVCLDGTPISDPGPTTCGDDGGSPPPVPDVATPPDTGSGVPDVRTDTTTGGAPDGRAGAGGSTTTTTGSSGAGGATTTTTGAGGSGTAGASTGAGGTTAGAGGSSDPTTGAGGSGTAGRNPTDPETPGGCGCRLTGPSNASALPAYALLGLALIGWRRSRDRSAN